MCCAAALESAMLFEKRNTSASSPAACPTYWTLKSRIAASRHQACSASSAGGAGGRTAMRGVECVTVDADSSLKVDACVSLFAAKSARASASVTAGAETGAAAAAVPVCTSSATGLSVTAAVGAPTDEAARFASAVAAFIATVCVEPICVDADRKSTRLNSSH